RSFFGRPICASRPRLGSERLLPRRGKSRPRRGGALARRVGAFTRLIKETATLPTWYKRCRWRSGRIFPRHHKRGPGGTDVQFPAFGTLSHKPEPGTRQPLTSP